MDLPELLEIRRINQALPFADPIAAVHMWGEREVVIAAGSWRVEVQVKRVARRRARVFKRLARLQDEFNRF